MLFIAFGGEMIFFTSVYRGVMFLFLLRVRFDRKFGFRFCGKRRWGWSFARRGQHHLSSAAAPVFVRLFPSGGRDRWWRCQGRFFDFNQSSSRFGRQWRGFRRRRGRLGWRRIGRSGSRSFLAFCSSRWRLRTTSFRRNGHNGLVDCGRRVRWRIDRFLR